MSLDEFVARLGDQTEALAGSIPAMPADAKVDDGGTVTLTFRSSAIATIVRDYVANFNDLLQMSSNSLLLELARAVRDEPRLLQDVGEDSDPEDVNRAAIEFIESDQGRAFMRELLGNRLDGLMSRCVGDCIAAALKADRALEE